MSTPSTPNLPPHGHTASTGDSPFETTPDPLLSSGAKSRSNLYGPGVFGGRERAGQFTGTADYDGSGSQISTTPRSKGIAIMLALFLGYFGAHNFYLGDRARGIRNLVVWAMCAAVTTSTMLILAMLPIAVLVMAEIAFIASGSGPYQRVRWGGWDSQMDN